MRGLRRDAEGSQVAETGSEAHNLSLRFSPGMEGVMEGYILGTASTSVEPPILYRRLRPMCGRSKRSGCDRFVLGISQFFARVVTVNVPQAPARR
jgi:hypothetical protein